MAVEHDAVRWLLNMMWCDPFSLHLPYIPPRLGHCSTLSAPVQKDWILDLWESTNQNIGEATSEKILKEVRLQRQLIDSDNLFKQQSILISDINKELSSDVFNNFVPNYKTLATIDQIFSAKTSPKNRVILEGEIVNDMKNEEKHNEPLTVDNITYRTFVKKFNEKYETDLLSEQKNY